MKEVPNIISTKDLSYIKDMASWNLVMAKKIKSYILLPAQAAIDVVLYVCKFAKLCYNKVSDKNINVGGNYG